MTNNFLKNAPFAYTYNKIIVDKNNKPIDYLYLDFNEKYEFISGLKYSNSINKTFNELYPNYNNEFNWIEYFSETAIKGISKEKEYYSNRSNKWFRIEVFSQKKYFFTAIFIDITNEKKWNKLINHIIMHDNNSVAVFDTKMNYIYASKRLLKKYGLSENKLIGRNHYEVVSDIPSEWKLIHEKALKGTTSFCEEDIFIRDSGDIEYVRWQCRPWYNLDDTIGGIIIYSEVITDKIKNKKEMLLAKQSAEKANKSKTLFLSKISHDIKNPLNNILSVTNIFNNEKLEEHQKEYINIIKSSTEEINNLINDLLDISRIESKKIELNNNAFNFIEFMYDFVSHNKYSLNIKNNKIELKIDKNIPDIIIGDKHRIKRILNNLVSNSNKFTSNGIINIEITFNGETENTIILDFNIKDNGKGINKSKLDKLFQEYYQAHEYNGEGYGLGLNLVKELIELMNGKIYIDSKLGEGTIVQFTIKLEKFYKNT